LRDNVAAQVLVDSVVAIGRLADWPIGRLAKDLAHSPRLLEAVDNLRDRLAALRAQLLEGDESLFALRVDTLKVAAEQARAIETLSITASSVVRRLEEESKLATDIQKTALESQEVALASVELAKLSAQLQGLLGQFRISNLSTQAAKPLPR
jgi:hypothetical protein